MKSSICFILFMAMLCSIVIPARAITSQLTLANYEEEADCGGVTPGGTTLLPWGELDLRDEATALAVLQAIESQYPVGDEGQLWQYSVSETSLDGDVFIDWYKATDFHPIADICRHGAEIVLVFDADPIDELLGYDFDWINIFTESGGSGNRVLEVDGTEDLDPAYYTPTDVPWMPNGYVPSPGVSGMIFTDAPSDPHFEALPWSGGVEFMTFIAGYSDIYDDGIGNLMQDIVLFDAICWGYEGVCYIPEPITICLLGFGGAVLLRRKNRA